MSLAVSQLLACTHSCFSTQCELADVIVLRKALSHFEATHFANLKCYLLVS